MRSLLFFVFVTVTLSSHVSVLAQATPVMEMGSLLTSLDVQPSGLLVLEDDNDSLTSVFLPKGADVVAEISRAGSTTPLHTQDFYINHVTPVFASLQARGKYKAFTFQQPGDYVLTFRSGRTVMTQVPFTVFTKKSEDVFDPKTAWYMKGPWNDWAYAYSRLSDGADGTLEFRMWAQRVSFENVGRATDKYDVELKFNGDVIAVTRQGHCGSQKWQPLRYEMQHPQSKGGRKFAVKEMLARDGTYNFVVKKNQKLHAVYQLAVKDNKPVNHPRQSATHKPRTEYIVPRYAALTAPGESGNTVWMKRLTDSAAKAIADGQAASVAGPSDAQRKRWNWLPTSIDPQRPFQFSVTDVETRTDTGFQVGEDLIVFGTGFPSGVKYLVAGENQPRDIPNGETYSSKVFRVCGKKIILTKRSAVFVFDTESKKLTAIPETEISLYDGKLSLLRANGYLVATVNKATNVTDRTIVKVIDVSGDAPVVIPIKNSSYTDRDISSVAVDAKRGHVAMASRSKKLIAAAKIAPLANQTLIDVAEFRGVDNFDISLEDEVVTYADQDWKVRSLKLGRQEPKAVTQEPIARSGNGFWIRKGRLVAVTKDGKYGSRYPIVISDSDNAPQRVAGTGTKIPGTSASLGMGGSIAIAVDKTVFLAGTPGDSIGVGERLQVLTDSGWQPIMGPGGKPVWGSEVVTSMGFMALKVRNAAGKTVIGYATYGERIGVLQTAGTGSRKPPMTSKPGTLNFEDENIYNTNDEQQYALLKAFLDTEKQIGKAFSQAFGKEQGAKKTVEAVTKSMKAGGKANLIDDYLRMSAYVAEKDRPETANASGVKAAGQNDPAAVQKHLQGEWKALRFAAEGKDLPDAAIENLSLTFANGRYVLLMGAEVQTGTYDIDCANSPMSMTIHIGSGDKKGQDRKGSFKLLKNNRLLIVFATDEEGHPQKFVPDAAGGNIMAVYEKRR